MRNPLHIAARKFGVRLGASDPPALRFGETGEHLPRRSRQAKAGIRQRFVRSEQQRLSPKDQPPRGLARKSLWTSLFVGHSPTWGMLPPQRLVQRLFGANKYATDFSLRTQGGRRPLRFKP